MKWHFAVLAACAFTGMVWSAPVEAEVISLRGDTPLDAIEKEIDRRRQITNERGFQRDWKQQPPLVPHKIDKDQITVQANTCMKCHGPDTYKAEGAPKVGDSHVIKAEGGTAETLNMQRYFCNQCHVPQSDANPLVENTFNSN